MSVKFDKYKTSYHLQSDKDEADLEELRQLVSRMFYSMRREGMQHPREITIINLIDMLIHNRQKDGEI